MIAFNTVLIAIEDPLSSDYSSFRSKFDIFFLAFYSAEFLLKVSAFGLIATKSSYFRDLWNLLDFVVVLTSWIDYSNAENLNLQVLRTFRILRTFKSISSLKGLRLIFIALLTSVKPLLAAFALFSLVISIFAIAGMQLWSGLLLKRCMDIETGFIYFGKVCGSYECGIEEKCVQSLENPNRGITNFDNFLSSSLVVYQCITLEGWIQIMYLTQDAFGALSLLYFLPLVFIGALIFLNLFMAIIKSTYSKAIIRVELNQQEDEIFRSLETQFLVNHFSDPTDSGANDISEIQFTVLPSKSRVANSVNDQSIPSFTLKYPLKSFKDMKSTLPNNKSFYQDQEHNEALKKLTLKHISCLFQRMNSTIRINKEVLRRINKGEKFESTSIMIKEFTMNIESATEVIPGYVQGSSHYLYKKHQDYSFTYIKPTDINEDLLKVWKNGKNQGLDEIEDNWSDFLKFQRLAERFDEVGAFSSIYFPTKSFCEQINQIESITKTVKGVWSGQDVQPYTNLLTIESLNNMKFRIWSKGILGHIQKLRHPFILIIDSKIYQIFILLSVITNTLVLSIDHYGISTESQDALTQINVIFTFIFVFEMSAKLLAYPPSKYFRDIMNYFDLSVVVLSLIEVYLLSNSAKSAISAFRAARIFRVFRMLRILRIAKIFRYVKSLAHLVKVIGISFSRYMYLGLLLLILLIIYSLIGMQIFAGKFETSRIMRSNFDNFHTSFVSTFQILSVENWQSILYLAMSSDVGYASCIFIISWIILGNYIILNLFLAILLESFSNSEVEEMVRLEKEKMFKGHSERMKRKVEEKMKLIEDLNSDSECEHSITKTNTVKINVMSSSGKSFLVFGLGNKLRQVCIKVSFSAYFEYFILVIICISSVKLAFDTYLDNESQLIKASDIIDYVFSAIFMLEFCIKTIGRGFISGEGSYLKDKWNYIDFVVVISSILDLAISTVSFSQIKVTRLLRTLRPFRYINYNNSMKVVVVALLQSIVAIFNVVFIQGIVLLMFAILGVSLLAGKLYNCSDDVSDSMANCVNSGYKWQPIWPNYDNVLNTLTTLIILSSEEGWPDIMNLAIDAKDIEKSLGYNENPMIAYFFIVFITISSFLFMNLFIGVVYEKFNEAKIHEQSLAASFLSKDQMIWVDMQKLILKTRAVKLTDTRPSLFLNKLSYKIYKNIIFQVFITLIIALNMLMMTFQYYGASKSLFFAIETLNLIFTSIFLLECVLKILALGSKGYFSSYSNIFDFCVVILSIIDIILTYVFGSVLLLLRRGPQMIRIIRVFRVSKFIRLFKSMQSLRNLIDIIAYSLPSIINVLTLLILIFFIYSIIGVNLFSSVNSGRIIDSDTNFENFGKAMLILFRCSTGEDWYNIMFDCGKAVNMLLAQVYFLSFITLVVFVMLNLFAMVIIHHYEDFERNNGNFKQIFMREVKKIRSIWNTYAKKSKGVRVHIDELISLVKELGEFSFSLDDTNEKVLRFLRAIDLTADEKGFVYYHQFLFALLRRKYLRRGLKMHLWKVVKNEERKTKAKIRKIVMNEKKIFEKEKEKEKELSYMERSTVSSYVRGRGHLRKVFEAWSKYVKKRAWSKEDSLDSIILSGKR